MRIRDRLYEAVTDPPAAPPAGPTAAEQELARLKAALAAPAPPPPSAPPPFDKKAIETQFWQDPLAMSAAIAQAAQQNNPGNETLIEVAMGQARGTDPDNQAIFDKYLDEIKANVATVQPQFRTNVAVWRNAFNFVKGQHFDEIFGERTTRNASAAIRTNDGPATPGVRAPNSPPKSKLTEEESYIAKNLGLTEDQYRHGKTIIDNQHGRETSPWDDVVTIDSQVQRRQRAADKRAKPNAV